MGSGVSGLAQLSDKEQQGLDDVLMVGGLRRSDFSYDRYSFAKPRMLPLIDMGISQPFDAASSVMKLHASSAETRADKVVERALYEGLARSFGDPVAVPEGAGLTLEQLPQSLRAPVARLVSALRVGDALIRNGLQEFTPAEQRTLIEALPRWAVEERKVTFEFVKQPMPSDEDLFKLLDKLKPLQVHRAGWMLSTIVEEAVGQLKASPDDVQGLVRLNLGGMVVEVAGKGANVHTSTDARLVIDLGGDDVYRGRAGAGIGYSSVLIDLGGDDRVLPKDLSVGAGLLGVGIARFVGGNDRFETSSLSLGTGIAGVGIFVKEGGNDVYSSRSLAQGFGLAGLGLHLDTEGSDSYDIGLMGQGAGRWFGMGWLVDRKGRDIYRAGGLSLNSPLFESAHYSFAQGFGMGYRQDSGGRSGGIGLLTDHEGDDSYLGETYHQGASYWLALGSLYDGKGNDNYVGHHYCQSSAMHITGAYLFDLAGDDGYSVKVGAAHAIGHDYGTAFFLDRTGNDIYASRDSNPSIGTANGSAIFVDGEGTDRYNGPPGSANASRGTGSLGVFADLGGPDLYRTGLADSLAVVRPSWGAAYDQADPPSAAGSPTAQAPWPELGSAPLSEAATAEAYRKAIQWGVGSAEAEVQKNLRTLVAAGLPAWKWMVDRQLAEADRLSLRAFSALAPRMGAEGKAYLVAKADTAKGAELANLISVCSSAGVTELAPKLPGLISEPSVRMAAIAASGSLQAKEAVPALVAAAREGGIVMRASLVALAQIGDAGGLPVAQALAAGDDPLARKAALQLMAKHPAEAAAAARELLGEADDFRARIGLQILGALGTPSSLALIGESLGDARAALRLEAVLQLSGRCPPGLKEAARALRKDPVEMVAAAARGAQLD